MVFNSIDFLVFFPIVVLLYFVVPKRIKTYWLLIASYVFYMSWNKTYALLILASTVVTYISAILIKKVPVQKLVLIVCFVVNLGILFSFKYLNFVISNIDFIAKKLGGTGLNYSLNILLPVGISFYTFQALGYIVDVYRGEIEPEHNFIKYALFVSFFPQLVAGPIERSKNLISQIDSLDERRLFNYNKAVSGFSLMCYGMFLKVVLADRLAGFVDSIWNNLHVMGMTEGIFAAVAFSLQIYCDFSAYSTIAIGAARIMGFELMENFNTPYFATSISEFWRRWHISLSSWFKDYLYIPLGGSRCGKMKKYRNLMIVFLVSGLWHGANWTYVIWGAIHGLYQVLGDLLKPVKRRFNQLLKINTEVFSYKIGQIIVTFMLTAFAWIFFRAGTISEAGYYLKRMLTNINPWVLFDKSMYEYGIDITDYHIIIAGLLILLAVDIVRYIKKVDFGTFLLAQNMWFRWAVLIMLIVGTVVYGAYGIEYNTAQFIYFQF